MQPHVQRLAVAMLVGVAGVAGCRSEPSPTGPVSPPDPSVRVAGPTFQYLLGTRAGGLPADIDARTAAAGGTVIARVPQIGLAVVRTSDPGFRERISAAAFADVAEDVVVQWHPGERAAEPRLTVDAPTMAQVLGGSDETFFGLQWAPAAIHAPEAWAAGYAGRGARVAVVDGGIHSSHVDLAPNLDVAHSVSFALDAGGNTIPFDQDVGTFWHGTHVAGIVAAADNGVGSIGIAPQATLIGVKVLHNGSGSFGALIRGIVYAATPISEGGGGADIINLSLGAVLDPHGRGDVAAGISSARDAAQLAAFLGKATTYAHQRGVVLLAAAGNGDASGVGIDFDHTNNLIGLPAQSPHVVAVSALGPVGWAQGATDFDRLASYSNFGQSLIGLGGPGGDFVFPGNHPCSRPSPIGPIVQPCWVFDLVLSTIRGGTDADYGWAAGTSMATPAVAGVAALIVGKFGRIDPARVEAKLRAAADDLGKPGNDDAYGAGRVNALRAVQ